MDTLDEILGDLAATTYHYDGKESTLISPKALKDIKTKLTKLIQEARIDELERLNRNTGGWNTKDKLKARIKTLKQE